MKTRWWYRVQGGTNLITSLAATVFLLQVVAARSRYLPVDEIHFIEFLNFFDPDTWIRIILCQVNFLRSGCTCFSISLPFEKLFPPLLGKKQRIYGRTLSDSPTDLKVLETDLNDMEAGELTSWKQSSRSFLNWLPHVLTSKYSCFSPSR